MASRGLSQRDLAQLLDVSLDRVKSLTAGRVQKLAPAEAKALVEKLHVHGEYLATGKPPIFKRPNEMELERRMEAIGSANKISHQVQDQSARHEVQRQVFEALVGSLDAREQHLLSCFRRADERGKVAVLRVAESLTDEDPEDP